MKIIALIPARYDSKRFLGKALAPIAGKSLIARTYEGTAKTGLFDQTIVATDDERIREEILSIGGEVFLSREKHNSGSDRIAEAAGEIEADIVVNVQGDEPFVEKEPLEKLIELLDDERTEMATLCSKIESDEEFRNSNVVKVVLDSDGFALYFSRGPIPYDRDGSGTARRLRHIGIYAFRREALIKFASLPQSALEQSEKLEQLRALESGMRIRAAVVDFENVGVDAPEDIRKAEEFLKRKSGNSE